MSAHTRIDAATKAISTARLDAGWNKDGDHQAAVLLESRGHLSDKQVIPADSQVRRMRLLADRDGVVHRVVPVDLPDGRTAEVWVDPAVAALLAAQIADGPVRVPVNMGDYRRFAEGELTGLQEHGEDCARCGREVEVSAVAVRPVGWTTTSNPQVLACHPACGSSPWDVEQLRRLLEMPDVEPDGEELPPVRLTCDGCGFDAPARYVGDRVLCWSCSAPVSDGSPRDLFDPCDPAGGEA